MEDFHLGNSLQIAEVSIGQNYVGKFFMKCFWTFATLIRDTKELNPPNKKLDKSTEGGEYNEGKNQY